MITCPFSDHRKHYKNEGVFHCKDRERGVYIMALGASESHFRGGAKSTPGFAWATKILNTSSSIGSAPWRALLSFRAVIPNLGSPDVPGLKFPEAFITSYAGQDFWEL